MHYAFLIPHIVIIYPMVYLTLIYSPLIWAMDLSTRLLSRLISCLHFAESFVMISFFPMNIRSGNLFIPFNYFLLLFIYNLKEASSHGGI